MLLQQRYLIRAVLLIVIWVPCRPAQGKEISRPTPSCPIGFTLIYRKAKNTPFCIRRKGPETFVDKYTDCVGNLYTSKLYQELNISKPDYAIWTEYRTLYPGGVFVDWSYTKSIGDSFKSEKDIAYDRALDLEGDLCLVMDPVSNFTAVECNAKHYGYCVVKPYVYKDSMTKKGCEGLKDSFRFWSPVSTCVTTLTGVGGGAVRATWNQAQELCGKKGGYLLGRGWRYSNYREFRYASDPNHTYPLGIVMSSDHVLLRYDALDDRSVIPTDEWSFGGSFNSSDTLLGALRSDFWHLVNSSYIFYDVICERTVPMKNVTLKVTIDIENKLTLNVNDSLDKDDIYCFTDSVLYYPVQVRKEREDDTNVYVLKPKHDGYYWCTHINMKNYKIMESNKVLFIREKDSLVNFYAIKLRCSKPYKLDDIDKLYQTLESGLKEYIYLRTKYESVFGDINSNITEGVLKGFKASNPSLDWNDERVIVKMKIKRLYLDRRSVLIHVELYPEIKPVTPGFWEGVEILSMKPAFYCKGFDSVPQLYLGHLTKSAGCRTHTCVGDFNEGVQWVTTASSDCTTRSPVAISKTLQFDAQDVTQFMPTLHPDMTRRSPITREQSCENSSEEPAEREGITDDYNITSSTPTTTTCSEPQSKSTASVTPTVGSTVDRPTEVSTVDTPPTEVSTVNTPTEGSTWWNTTEDTTVMPNTTVPSNSTTTTASPTTRLTTNTPTEGNSTVSTTEEGTTDSNTTAVSSITTPLPITTTPPPPIPTTILPEEELEEVINDLDNLINGSAPITVEDISNVFDQVDNILEVHDNLEIPGRLLHLLDNLGSAIELNGTSSSTTVRNNIALVLADANPTYPVRGMTIATRDTDEFTDEAFQIISEEINSTVLESERNEVVVSLPQSVSDASRRVSFVVFRNDRAFQTSDGSYAVNSRVLSIKVENVTTFENGEVIDIHLNPLTADPYRNTSRTCAYWKFLENETGAWSSDGCTLIRATQTGQLDTCRCDHLTHFAEVLFPRSVFSQKNEDVLEVLTIVGCSVSMFGLIIVGVTAAMFRSWRRDFSNKIWLQLCVSIFLLALSFIIVIFAKFDHYSVFCMIIGILLHYAVLSSFCWMLVAAVLSYRRLVLVFTRDASHKLLRASAFSWGVPFAIIGVLLSAAPQSYAGRFEEKTPNGSFCYPSGLSMWLAVYAPIALILLANWTLFALIVRSVFASRRIQRHGDTNEALRCASVSCLLVFLFGLPWIFGLFAFNVVAAYLFTLTATYQGFVLFLFFVLGNKKTRDLWLNKLRIKQTRKVPVTSSTFSNRSTGWRGGTQPATTEAKTSKPKSLNQDDSRFS